MNVHPFVPRPVAASNASAAPAPSASSENVPAGVRHLHRERDFGVGYGNSSGYASNPRYARNWVQPLFRCA